MANGGEFATSTRIRWIGSISDGASRSVTAGDLSGPLLSQSRPHLRQRSQNLWVRVSAGHRVSNVRLNLSRRRFHHAAPGRLSRLKPPALDHTPGPGPMVSTSRPCRLDIAHPCGSRIRHENETELSPRRTVRHVDETSGNVLIRASAFTCRGEYLRPRWWPQQASRQASNSSFLRMDESPSRRASGQNSSRSRWYSA